MACNKVRFQKGLSEPGFERLYGSEEQCRAAVVASRWPDGFVCPECGGRRHSFVTCSIPDDHIDPRRSALFMARSVLREARDGDRTC